MQLARLRPDRRKIDMHEAERIARKSLAGLRAFSGEQAADLMALEETMQRRPSQMRNRRLESIEPIIER